MALGLLRLADRASPSTRREVFGEGCGLAARSSLNLTRHQYLRGRLPQVNDLATTGIGPTARPKPRSGHKRVWSGGFYGSRVLGRQIGESEIRSL